MAWCKESEKIGGKKRSAGNIQQASGNVVYATPYDHKTLARIAQPPWPIHRIAKNLRGRKTPAQAHPVPASMKYAQSGRSGRAIQPVPVDPKGKFP